MKEVKFLTEKSQDKEKNLSFKEQILKDLAGEKEEQTPSSTSQSEADSASAKETAAADDFEARPASVDVSYKVAENEKAHPQVYGRVDEPCERCGRLIQKVQFGGRGTHFCPHCQPARLKHPQGGKGHA